MIVIRFYLRFLHIVNYDDAKKLMNSYVKMKKILLLTALFSFALVSMTVKAGPATVTVSSEMFHEGENVSITYTDLPIGCNILLYKDLSLQPMKEMMQVHEGAASGTFEVGTGLEPGIYHVRCLLEAD